MKKIFSVIALFFTAILALSGCVNMNVGVDIQGTDKVTGSVEVTTAKESLQGLDFKDLMAQQVDMSKLDSMLAGQWTYTEVNDGENVGIRFDTAKTMNYTELADAFSVFNIPVTVTDNGKEFTFTMPGSGQTAVDSSFTEAKVAVSFPGSVVSHSAGEVEHNTVTFDLIEGAEVYTATGKANHALFYSIVFGGALLVLTFVFAGAFAPKANKDAH
ncbi:hypothetical protein AUR04nite_21770 [Glutamicibacter uratoxydans]|uniref:LppM domain-containing protein n=1 Tax=Glutamicibacter uratoxydans TaxID=43667 RepID=A0A4Y4DSR8_GLUUR|nr:hypothetical protein [Glutamicibacter uratoxydans]GED06645.1 hypothetical protein AUR04nite_21770 [Glutamicibacter uratoxydans]